MTSRFVGTPYNQLRSSGSFDAIVIGSGIGGLGIAAFLAKAAHRRVLVLEKHYTAGGFTHVFHRPGFEWDVGVHYVGQVHKPGSPAHALFEYLTEGRLVWNAMPDVYDRVNIDGLRFDYVSGRDRLREALVQTFPRERTAIDRYFTTIQQCVQRVPFYYVEKSLPRFLGSIFGRGLRAPFLKFARRTTADVLDALGASRELRGVLTAQWGDYGLPPGQSSFGMHAVIAEHYFDGAAYPIGGASQIAAGVLPVIERSGGTVAVSAEVDRILVDGVRAVGVRMADGREFRANLIVSDAGIRTTMDRLLGDGAPEAARRAAERTRRLPPAGGHLCLYVGATFPSAAPTLDAANLWIHPSLDFDGNLSAFDRDLEAPFPFLYISFPSAKDPSFAARYSNRHTIEVLTAVSYKHFAQWAGSDWKRRPDAYAAIKARLAERLLRELYRHVPAVSGAVIRSEFSTPLSTQHFAGAPHGEMYGLAHTPMRFQSRDLGPRTAVGNLFLTGQDVGTCGVMGALSGALATASTILGRNMFGEVLKARSLSSTRHAGMNR
ncbi:MAG TPA: NAD(P)/FAD-dependent oxidoreductase [Vicinamibacterales bacterium]|jgi:all-trans-retinol 13,14-reductase